jgi:amino acid transporter
MLLAVIILSVLFTIAICGLIACYIIIGINLDKIRTYENWVMDFNKDVQNTYNQLKQLDDRNIFSKDDDVGFAFSQIVSVMEKLKDKIK